jgi:hypothetical protein
MSGKMLILLMNRKLENDRVAVERKEFYRFKKYRHSKRKKYRWCIIFFMIFLFAGFCSSSHSRSHVHTDSSSFNIDYHWIAETGTDSVLQKITSKHRH